MFAKRSARAMALLLALPSAAFALGLGDIHLHSPLNAPLDADIELVDVAPDEANTVQVQLASRDTFARYGLDWPTYLSSIKVTTARGSDGRQTIRLRSSEPITEPFVTLLVDVSWSRGHLVREYTMLLDPPVYAPGESAVASAPVTAPATGTGAREGSIARAAEAPAAAAARAGGSRACGRPRNQQRGSHPRSDSGPDPDSGPGPARARGRRGSAGGCRERQLAPGAARRDAVGDRQRRRRRGREHAQGAQLDARDLPGQPRGLPPEHERAALGRGAAHPRGLPRPPPYPRPRRPPRSAASTPRGAARRPPRPRRPRPRSPAASSS